MAESDRGAWPQFPARLPPPGTLKEYEAILPGFTERMVAAAESKLKHDQQMERRGQVFALVVGLAGLASSVAIMKFSPNAAGATAAAVVGGATLGSMVVAFIVGQRSKLGAKLQKSEPVGAKR